MALSYDQLEQKEAAIQSCQEALKIDPNHLDSQMLYHHLTEDGKYPHSEMHRRLVEIPMSPNLSVNLIDSE